jgi:hypothetical protein
MVASEELTAMCVQRFDDSRNSAIHTTYRISLRSSSLREPRYPLLRVISDLSLRRAGGPRRRLSLQVIACPGVKKKGPAKGRPAVPRGYPGVGRGEPDSQRRRVCLRAGSAQATFGRPSIGRPGALPQRLGSAEGGSKGGARVDRMVSMILPQVHLT